MQKEEFKNLLNEDYRDKKLAELHALPSSIDKIKYWYKLGFSWLDQQDYDSFHDIPLAPFKFHIPQEELKEVNLWILKNYQKLSWLEQKEKHLKNLDSLIEDFEQRLAEAIDKKDYVLKEQMKIDKSFQVASQVRSTGIFRTSLSVPSGISAEYFASAESFFNFLHYGQAPDYSEIDPRVGMVLRMENGVTMAKFRQYLNDRVKELSETPELSAEATRAQKMLLLHYLGVLEYLQKEIPVQATLTKVLQLLINAHPDNIKKDIAAMYRKNSKLHTEENLTFVANALDLAGKDKKAEQVRDILSQLYKAQEK